MQSSVLVYGLVTGVYPSPWSAAILGLLPLLGVIGVTDRQPPAIENLVGMHIEPKLISEMVLESEQQVCRLRTNPSAVAQ